MAENEERYPTKNQSFFQKRTVFVGYLSSFLTVCRTLRLQYKYWDPQSSAFYRNCFELLREPIRGQLNTITVQKRNLGSRSLYFLNFVTCKQDPFIRHVRVSSICIQKFVMKEISRLICYLTLRCIGSNPFVKLKIFSSRMKIRQSIKWVR